MRALYIIILVFAPVMSYGQNQTDASLFFKRDNIQISEVQSKSGNLFNKLGHHGPAIENQWIALRMYFKQNAAIDVYSKSKPGLELREKQWYPSKADQQEGWGADRYKVGNTVGLGGVKLWDGEALVDLKVDHQRRAIVVTGKDSSYMEMVSEGVPYKDGLIEVRVRVTVYSDKREAKVEAFIPGGEKVQFATGINYFKNLSVVSGENYVLTWGLHPEDVASTKVEVGAALIYNKESIDRKFDTGKQIILVSKASSYLQTWVSSANADEEEINSIDIFRNEVENLSQ